MLQLLRVGHAAAVRAGGGGQARGHAADAGGAAVGGLLVVRRLAAAGELGRGGVVERADGGAVGHAGGGSARCGLEELDGRGGGGTVAAVHAGALAQVAQGQQAVLQAGHVLAGAAAGQAGAQQGRGRGVAGVEHALGGHVGDAGLLHAAGGLHALESGDGVGGEVAGGHAVQVAQGQQGALQGLDRVAAVLVLQLGVAGGAQGLTRNVAGLAADLHLHPLGIVAVEVEGVAHGQADAGGGGGLLGVGLRACDDHGAAAHSAAVGRAIAARQLAVLGERVCGAVAVVAVELDVGPAAGDLQQVDLRTLLQRAQLLCGAAGALVHGHAGGGDGGGDGSTRIEGIFGRFLRRGAVRLLLQALQRAEAVLAAQADVGPVGGVGVHGDGLSGLQRAQLLRGGAGAGVHGQGGARDHGLHGLDGHGAVAAHCGAGARQVAGGVGGLAVGQEGIGIVLGAAAAGGLQAGCEGVAHVAVLLDHRPVAGGGQYVNGGALLQRKALAGGVRALVHAVGRLHGGGGGKVLHRDQRAELGVHGVAAVADPRHLAVDSGDSDHVVALQIAHLAGERRVCVGGHAVRHGCGVALRQRGRAGQQHQQHQQKRRDPLEFAAFVIHLVSLALCSIPAPWGAMQREDRILPGYGNKYSLQSRKNLQNEM